ncbi:MAG: dockerin type I domain-containing protein, partial [Dehalococcoidia bacterium]
QDAAGSAPVPFPDAADVNGDDEIDALDALLVLQLSAGMITGFPAGQLSSMGLFMGDLRFF